MNYKEVQMKLNMRYRVYPLLSYHNVPSIGAGIFICSIHGFIPRPKSNAWFVMET